MPRRAHHHRLTDEELTHRWREAVLEALVSLDVDPVVLEVCYTLGAELESRQRASRVLWCTCSDCMARVQQDEDEPPF